MKCLINGPFNLGGLEARPKMIVTKEAHGMKVFFRLGPLVNIISVRIGLGKAHDYSLFMHPSYMFNVYI